MEFVKKYYHALSLFAVPQFILLFLRLCEIITCSWFIVFLPLEIFAGILVISYCLGIIIGVAIGLANKKTLEEIARESNVRDTDED